MDPTDSSLDQVKDEFDPPITTGSKRPHTYGALDDIHQQEGSDAIDTDLLNKKLLGVQESREATIMASPSKKRIRYYGDRYAVTPLNNWRHTDTVVSDSFRTAKAKT